MHQRKKLSASARSSKVRLERKCPFERVLGAHEHAQVAALTCFLRTQWQT